MSLPVFRADGPLTDVQVGTTVTFTGAEARHAATVRRLGPGEHLDVVDGQGTRVTGEIVSARAEEVSLAAISVESDAERGPRVVLVQALAKADRDLQAVESCTELGIDEVVAWQADRSVARFRPERAHKQLEKWRNTITSAAKQSRRSRWPVLQDPVDSTGLARLIAGSPGTTWWILHESAPRTLVSVLAQELGMNQERDAGVAPASVGIVVGPEGGISDVELERFVAAGAEPVRLGPEVLRSSTAGAAAVVLVNMASGRWR